MKCDTLLIDGPYQAYKSYSAPYKLTTSKGLDATLIHTFFRTLNSLKKKFSPRRIVVTWESYGTKSWRKDEYPDYKKGRKRMDNVYWESLVDVQSFLYLLGVEQFYSPHNEADDVISKLVDDGYKTVISTTDKDLMQLVSDNVFIWDGKMLFDAKEVKKKYLVEPYQIPDLLAMWGDQSDNIEGLKGYGRVKSAKVLRTYGDVEHIPEFEIIYKYRNKMLFNKKLTTLSNDCVLKVIPKGKVNDTIDSILDKYELKQIRKSVAEFMRKGALDKWL